MYSNSKFIISLIRATSLIAVCFSISIKVIASDLETNPDSSEFNLQIVQSNADKIRLVWDSTPGEYYRIEAASKLSDPEWKPLGTQPFLANSNVSETEALASGGQSYFRVVLVQDATPEPIIIEPGMVLVPSGSFMMGSPESEAGRQSDETQHEVQITRPFLMSQSELSLQEAISILNWAAANDRILVEDDGVYLKSEETELLFTIPASINYQIDTEPAFIPVSNTTWEASGNWTWHGAMAVAAWKNEKESRPQTVDLATWTIDFVSTGYRLPTEAEWEYACRAGTTTAFYTGDSLSFAPPPTLNPAFNPVIWIQDANYAPLIPPNSWGIFEAHSGGLEWVWDRYENFSQQPATDPAGPETGPKRVLRGAYYNDAIANTRSASRSSALPNDTRFGIRLARTLGSPLADAERELISISSPPASGTLRQGDSWLFSVDFSSKTPTTVQWYKNGVPIPGANEADLLLQSAQAEDSGQYHVSISNGFIRVDSNLANLNVLYSARTDGMVRLPAGYFWSRHSDAGYFFDRFTDTYFQDIRTDAEWNLEDPLPGLLVNPSRFWIESTEFTCEQAAPILQWGLENDLFVMNSGIGWSLPNTVLFDLNVQDCGIVFVENANRFEILEGMESYPFNGISYRGALSLCNWRSTQEGLETCDEENLTWLPDRNGYRLSNPQEWEYACRAGTRTVFHIGPETVETLADLDNALQETGWYAGNAEGRVHPVAELSPNSYGLFDMHGNLSEWVYFPESAFKKPTALRVGGAGNLPAEACFSGSVEGIPSSTLSAWTGFRMVRNDSF
jgi:formylglycine-generating enzyme required for sulfatase activity